LTENYKFLFTKFVKANYTAGVIQV